jgi:hypothetical protein
MCFLSIFPSLRLYPVIVAGGELHRSISIGICMAAAVWARGRRLVAAQIGTEIASVVLSFAVEKWGAVGSWGQSTVAVRVVKVIGVVRSVVAVAAVHGGGVVVVRRAWSIVVVHVDSLISLFVVRRHGKGSLVGIDVLPPTELAVIVAR